MQRFDAIDRRGHFAIAALGSPLLWVALIPGWANGWRGGDLTPGEVMALMAVAQFASLAALAWVLCSVAAYTVEPGRLVIHRVLWDHADPLPDLADVGREGSGVVRVVSGRQVRRVRAVDAEGCLAALRRAAASRKDRPPSAD